MLKQLNITKTLPNPTAPQPNIMEKAITPRAKNTQQMPSNIPKMPANIVGRLTPRANSRSKSRGPMQIGPFSSRLTCSSTGPRSQRGSSRARRSLAGVAAIPPVTENKTNCCRRFAEHGNHTMIPRPNFFLAALLQVSLLEPASAVERKSDECGLASVYSTDSESTASGEDTQPKYLTAAHRSLSFGTLVNVADQENGRSAVVRITDRGPFTSGRIIDLSKAAAHELRISGLTRVCLNILSTKKIGQHQNN